MHAASEEITKAIKARKREEIERRLKLEAAHALECRQQEPTPWDEVFAREAQRMRQQASYFGEEECFRIDAYAENCDLYEPMAAAESVLRSYELLKKGASNDRTQYDLERVVHDDGSVVAYIHEYEVEGCVVTRHEVHALPMRDPDRLIERLNSPINHEPCRVARTVLESRVLRALAKRPSAALFRDGIAARSCLSAGSTSAALKSLVELGDVAHVGRRGGFSITAKGLSKWREIEEHRAYRF